MDEGELYRGPMPKSESSRGMELVKIMCIRCQKIVEIEYDSQMGSNPAYCCGLEYSPDWVVQLVIQETDDAKKVHENKQRVKLYGR
jgi:hypothetical protein